MKKIAITSLLSFCLIIGILSCSKSNSEHNHSDSKTEHQYEHKNHQHSAEYQCPMKCDDGKTYPKEGECKDCGMALEQINEHDSHDEHGEHQH